jgi:hypothetical protein
MSLDGSMPRYTIDNDERSDGAIDEDEDEDDEFEDASLGDEQEMRHSPSQSPIAQSS